MKGQKGMASIVVVSVLVVIMTLISIGFARIMSRTVSNATNRQLSTAATYAAQSAINDVSAFIKTNPTAYSDTCNGSGTLIGKTGAPGPFYYDSNLSGDTTKTAHYTCLILNQTPGDLQYGQIDANLPRVVKLSTSAFSTPTTGSLEKLLFSWQSTNPSLVAGYPTNVCPSTTVINGVTICSSSSLKDETSWDNASSGICKDAANNPSECIPILRLTLYPIPVGGGSLANVQANSKTVFLLPQAGAGTVQNIGYTAIPDGALMPVKCTTSVGAADFKPTINPPLYACNIIISALTTSTSPGIDYFYATLTPIYNKANVEIQANDSFGQKLNFLNTQAMIDATATAGGVTKRLQARVDTSSISSVNGEDDNIPSDSSSVPADSVRSANAICKRVIETTSIYNYISYDEPNSICHDSPNTAFDYPAIALTISGQDYVKNTGPYVAATRDSQDVTPSGSTYNGVLYIPAAPNNSTIAWKVDDSTTCTSSWPPGSVPLTQQKGNTGSYSALNVSVKTDYTLTCSRVGGGVQGGNNTTNYNFSATRTVSAWPPPSVSLSGPGSVHAGDSFNISWSVINATGCTFSGDWADSSPVAYSGVPASGSRTNYTTWNQQINRSYTMTCTDPVGRSSSSTYTLNYGGGGNGQLLPPTCHASASITDNGDGTGALSWSGTCPDVSPGSGYYQLYNCSGINCGSIGSGGWVGTGGSVSLNPGSYCVQFRSGVDPWGMIADSGQQCGTVNYSPVVITDWNVTGPVYQMPECSSPGNWFDQTWWCGGGNPLIYNPAVCADGVHSVTVCGYDWGAKQVNGSVSCVVKSNGSGINSSPAGATTSGSGGETGWIGASANLTLICTGLGGRSASDSWSG